MALYSLRHSSDKNVALAEHCYAQWVYKTECSADLHTILGLNGEEDHEDCFCCEDTTADLQLLGPRTVQKWLTALGDDVSLVRALVVHGYMASKKPTVVLDGAMPSSAHKGPSPLSAFRKALSIGLRAAESYDRGQPRSMQPLLTRTWEKALPALSWMAPLRGWIPDMPYHIDKPRSAPAQYAVLQPTVKSIQEGFYHFITPGLMYRPEPAPGSFESKIWECPHASIKYDAERFMIHPTGERFYCLGPLNFTLPRARLSPEYQKPSDDGVRTTALVSGPDEDDDAPVLVLFACSHGELYISGAPRHPLLEDSSARNQLAQPQKNVIRLPATACVDDSCASASGRPALGYSSLNNWDPDSEEQYATSRVDSPPLEDDCQRRFTRGRAQKHISWDVENTAADERSLRPSTSKPKGTSLGVFGRSVRSTDSPLDDIVPPAPRLFSMRNPIPAVEPIPAPAPTRKRKRATAAEILQEQPASTSLAGTIVCEIDGCTARLHNREAEPAPTAPIPEGAPLLVYWAEHFAASHGISTATWTTRRACPRDGCTTATGYAAWSSFARHVTQKHFLSRAVYCPHPACANAPPISRQDALIRHYENVHEGKFPKRLREAPEGTAVVRARTRARKTAPRQRRGRGRAAARVVRDDDSYATTDDDAMDVSDETSQGTEMEVADDDDDDDETPTWECLSVDDGYESEER